MPLPIGTKLGPYEVVAPLGAGGMGEVYRAKDTGLGRDVAIKVLPDNFAQTPDRLERFQREAQILASLNHPNIAAIHRLEQQNGSLCLVLEYVPGETLADELQRGPLTIEESLEICKQIAEALEAAHEKGIVHRDLKPANIKITPEGKVKVLDFGLAKETVTSAGTDVLNSPILTVQSPAYTREGIILGTAAYMSPEQARGKRVDKRTDIWAFGCVLYECLTGKMPFRGDTVTDILAEVVKADPDWHVLPDAAGPRVRDLLRRCQKDPLLRLRDIGDARVPISEALVGDSSAASNTAAAPAAQIISAHAAATVAAAPARTARWFWPALAAACLIALVLGLGTGKWWGARSEPATTWTGSFLGGPELSTFPRLSPDGHLLAFVAKDSDDVMQVWVMKPESGNRVMLTHRRDLGMAGTCAWSPDGTRIYYDRYYDELKGVFSVPALGGEEQLVLESSGEPEALPDGSLLLAEFNSQHQLQLNRYWPDSGKSQALPVILPNGQLYGWLTLRAFPDGHRALVSGIPTDQTSGGALHFYVVNLDSGKLQALNADFGDLLAGGNVPAGAVTADGKSVVFASTRGALTRLMSIPVDGSAPAHLLFNLTGYLESVSVGPDGALYLDEAERPMEIVRFSPEGGHVERIATVSKPQGDYFAALPDGRALWVEYATGTSRLMIGAAGKEPVSILNTSEEVSGPLTAVGSDSVAFMIGQDSHRSIGVAALSNGQMLRRIAFDKGAIEQWPPRPMAKLCIAPLQEVSGR
jgi:hypothetical protein